MTDHLCPGCGLRLSSGSLGTAPLDLCVTCGGVWLNVPALRELLQSGPAVVRRLYGKVRAGRPGLLDQALAGGCPHCGGVMGRIAVPDVPNAPIYACAPCRGFWMTGAALEQLAATLDAREQSAPPPEASTPDPSTCPDCGEHNPPTAACCWACSRRLQGVAARACPACNGVVRPVPSPDVPLGACESCGGAWLEARRLGELLFRPESEQQQIFREIGRLKVGRTRPRNVRTLCPACGVSLRLSPVGAMLPQEVETCPRCAATFVEYETLEEMIVGSRPSATGRRSF